MSEQRGEIERCMQLLTDLQTQVLDGDPDAFGERKILAG
jgi:hypothetical protein